MKSGTRNAFRIIEFLLLLALTAAARAADPLATYPTNFLAAAKAFANAPATNRFNEAWALHDALPTTPLTYDPKEEIAVPNGPILYLRDENKLSYLLRENDAIRLLGNPSATNTGWRVYCVTAEEQRRRESVLIIFFQNGYVIDSAITELPKILK